jgi:predicted enzyme related to lactoylglutathione lyase
MPPARAAIALVVLDCADALALARFWGRLLGLEPERVLPGFIMFPPPAGGGIRLALQQVPEPKIAKNRAHVDLRVDDLAEARSWVEGLGGRCLDEHASGSFSWLVMGDPEGNEFCIFAGPREPDP